MTKCRDVAFLLLLPLAIHFKFCNGQGLTDLSVNTREFVVDVPMLPDHFQIAPISIPINESNSLSATLVVQRNDVKWSVIACAVDSNGRPFMLESNENEQTTRIISPSSGLAIVTLKHRSDAEDSLIVDDVTGRLYYRNENRQIVWSPLNRNDPRPITNVTIGKVLLFDIDLIDQTLVFFEELPNNSVGLFKRHLNGTGYEQLALLEHSPSALAIDSSTKFAYWIGLGKLGQVSYRFNDDRKVEIVYQHSQLITNQLRAIQGSVLWLKHDGRHIVVIPSLSKMPKIDISTITLAISPEDQVSAFAILSSPVSTTTTESTMANVTESGYGNFFFDKWTSSQSLVFNILVLVLLTALFAFIFTWLFNRKCG